MSNKRGRDTVTQVERKEAIDKIFELLVEHFEGIEITARFTKVLLEEAIVKLENKALATPMIRITKEVEE